jgi:hypothetical protein
MSLRHAGLAVVLLVWGAAVAFPVAHAAEPAKPAISAAASAAVQNMSKTLRSKDFSFRAQTIRVYQDESGDFLHIVHNLSVVARRPDRLAVKETGDDGVTELLYNGKTATVFDVSEKKYAQVAVPGNLEGMLAELAERLQVNFPLADFLTDHPGKSFLSGVSSGKEVNIVSINGTPCRHLFFTQAGDIDLELWVENNQRAVPRRLIVTYRALPGQPNFIAEFSDWQFAIHPSDAEFAFQPPAGATKVDLARAAEKATGANGGK